MTATFESLWAEYQPMVDGLCNQFGKGNEKHGASAGDFRHEAMVWIMDNLDKLSEKRGEFDDEERFGKYLYRCIENECKDYAVDIRDHAGGQPRVGAYFYSVNELKALLPSVLDKSKWLEPPQSQGKGSGIPAEGGNWLATLADVSRAFDQLPTEDRELLFRFHALSATNKSMALLTGVTEENMSRRHGKAVTRLQALLGGERPREMRPDSATDPWRGRRAISNAQARAVTSSYYEGDE